MTIAYELGRNLYLNITNRCSCRCRFCIRNNADAVGGGDSLWLEREPTTDEILQAVAERGPEGYDSVVFCGFGEPTERLDTLLEVCRHLRANPAAPGIRLNTNGLSDLVNGRDTASRLKGLVDTVSVSLNAPDPQRYLAVTRPAFGEAAFDSMLHFAARCKEEGVDTRFTAVDVLEAEELAACSRLADGMGIPLRVRVRIA